LHVRIIVQDLGLSPASDGNGEDPIDSELENKLDLLKDDFFVKSKSLVNKNEIDIPKINIALRLYLNAYFFINLKNWELRENINRLLLDQLNAETCLILLEKETQQAILDIENYLNFYCHLNEDGLKTHSVNEIYNKYFIYLDLIKISENHSSTLNKENKEKSPIQADSSKSVPIEDYLLAQREIAQRNDKIQRLTHRQKYVLNGMTSEEFKQLIDRNRKGNDTVHLSKLAKELGFRSHETAKSWIEKYNLEDFAKLNK